MFKKRILKTLAVMALVLCLVMGAASAATLLDQQQTAVGAQMSVPPEGLAQTFTAGKSGTLDRIDLYAGLTEGATPGDLSVEVVDRATGKTIAQANVPASDFAGDGSLSWVPVSFGSTAPTVTAGQQYRVYLRTPSYLWGYNGTGGYAGGEMLVCRTVRFEEVVFRRCDVFGEADAAFKTYVTDSTPPQTTIWSWLPDSPGPTNSTDAIFDFRSSESNSTFECSLDGAPFGACPSPSGQPQRAEYSGLSEGSHTFEVRATDSFGNSDPSADSRTWMVDTTAPTVVGASPANAAAGVDRNTNVEATFSEDMNASTLGANFTLYKQGSSSSIDCWSSPYSSVNKTATVDPCSDLEENTTYTATVEGGPSGAKDLAGNALAQDYSWTFTTAPDTIPPQTTIASGPSGYVKSTSASFSFSSSEAGSTFQCSRDGSTFSACTSPKSYPGPLGQGSHTFRVRAIDKAGNIDGTPASRSWFVDSVVPTGTISINGGNASTPSRSVILKISASDPSPASGVASMRFRNGETSTWSSWSAYSTSKSWTLTAGAGTKTVYVQYRDRAGNLSAATSDTIKFSP